MEPVWLYGHQINKLKIKYKIMKNIKQFKDFLNEEIADTKTSDVITEMLKEVYESACNEAIAYEGDDNKEHTVESYLKEMAAVNAGMMAEMYEKSHNEAKKEGMTKEAYESMCTEMKESFCNKIDETILGVINKYG